VLTLLASVSGSIMESQGGRQHKQGRQGTGHVGSCHCNIFAVNIKCNGKLLKNFVWRAHSLI
jgi:hypothetical protein